jgi:hypothetical protein
MPERSYVEMLNAIGDSLSNLACSSDAENGDGNEDDGCLVQSMQSEDDEAGGVIETHSTTVKHLLSRFQQNQIRLASVIQPGRRDAAYCFHK